MTQSLDYPLIEQYSRCYGMVPLWYPEAWEDLKWVHFYHESLRRLTYFFLYDFYIYLLMFQVRFVKNVTSWKEMKPAFYHGHVSFLDFTKCVSCAFVVPCADSLSLLRPMYLHEKCSLGFCIWCQHHWEVICQHSAKALWLNGSFFTFPTTTKKKKKIDAADSWWLWKELQHASSSWFWTKQSYW